MNPALAEPDVHAWKMAEFSRCRPWIEASLQTSPIRTHSIEHVEAGIASGVLQIWPTPNSCCVVEVESYPTGLKMLHGLIAGGKLPEILVTIEALEHYARSAGCHVATMLGRPGWMRKVPGYKVAYTTMYKDL